MRARSASRLAVATLVAAAGCAPEHDVTVRWRLDGGCAGVADQARVRIESRDDYDDDTALQTFALSACEDGEARVRAGNVATIVVEALLNDAVVGASAPVTLAPPITAGEDFVDVEVEVTRGRLTLDFTVAGDDCRDADAASFAVDVEPADPQARAEGLGDAFHGDVDCADDVARLVLPGARVGGRYAVRAATTIDGVRYATSEQTGDVVTVHDPRAFATIDLTRAD